MASQLPPTMRAWARTKRGSPNSALKLTTIPTPTPPEASSSDVLIRVSHVSLQFTSEFTMRIMPVLPFGGPSIPELELSGQVVAAGGKAPLELCDPGTRVVAFQHPGAAMALGRGVLSEYVRLPGANVVRIDEGADMAAASGISCSGSVALRLVRTAGIREGHVVLVNGASGSAGSLAVQLCKMRGAKVVGVASGPNEAIVRGFGADEFIDYRQHDLPTYLAENYSGRPFDYILDCVGVQALYTQSPAYLHPSGAVINIGALDGMLSLTLNTLRNMLVPTWLGGVPRKWIMFSTPPTRNATVEVARLVEEGRLRVPVDSVFALEEAGGAYARIATKRARGKVVVAVRSAL